MSESDIVYHFDYINYLTVFYYLLRIPPRIRPVIFPIIGYFGQFLASKHANKGEKYPYLAILENRRHTAFKNVFSSCAEKFFTVRLSFAPVVKDKAIGDKAI